MARPRSVPSYRHHRQSGCLMSGTDERPGQTRRILRQLATAYPCGNGASAAEQIMLRHHALQRMLHPSPVLVPYAAQLGELIQSERVEARRDFAHLLNMIRVVTLLHQRQREKDANGALVAGEEDYQIAWRLSWEAHGAICYNSSSAGRYLHESLHACHTVSVR